MKVIWTDLALEQVEEIHEYIAADSPGAASKWVAGMIARADSLQVSPQRGRVVPELGKNQVRELLVGNYRLIYRLEETCLFILTVRHGRRLLRDLPQTS